MANSDNGTNSNESLPLEVTDIEMDHLCEHLAERILRSRLVLDDKLKSMLYKLDDIECKLGVLKTSLETSVRNRHFRGVTTLQRKKIFHNSKNLVLRKSPSLPSLKQIYGKERAKEYQTSDSGNDKTDAELGTRTSVQVISLFTRSKRYSR